MKPKEGRYAPAVVRLHKESGTQSKPSSFHGIHVGALGIMALGQNHGVYCMPLFMQLMQGLDPVAKWEGSPYVHADMPLELQEIVYMAQAVRIASRSAYYLTDRASMSANAFAKIAEVNQILSKEESKPRVDMIVPCRKNVAMYKPVVRPKKPGRGPPATKGEQLSIESFAEDPSFEWRYGRAFIYGRKKKVRYKVANLLWGDTSAKRITLRFVLVDYMDGTPPYMLCSTDLQMGGLNMIKSYARRFLCEEQFKVNKHVFHGFSMHFWSKHIPKNSFIRKGNKNILDDVTSPEDRTAILKTLKAMETYITLAYITQGLAQMMAMEQEYGGPIHTYKQVRSSKSVKTSEENICQVITDYLDEIFEKYSDLDLIRFLDKIIKPETKDEAILNLL